MCTVYRQYFLLFGENNFVIKTKRKINSLLRKITSDPKVISKRNRINRSWLISNTAENRQSNFCFFSSYFCVAEKWKHLTLCSMWKIENCQFHFFTVATNWKYTELWIKNNFWIVNFWFFSCRNRLFCLLCSVSALFTSFYLLLCVRFTRRKKEVIDEFLRLFSLFSSFMYWCWLTCERVKTDEKESKTADHRFFSFNFSLNLWETKVKTQIY